MILDEEWEHHRFAVRDLDAIERARLDVRPGAMSPGGRRVCPGMTVTTPATSTATVGEGTATVTYDVHGDLGAATPERPALFLLGSPMDAGGFATLASLFTDRPVVTYDPRGAGRNPTDTTSISVEDHAADLAAVIDAVAARGAGPVDVFASSGGAVNVLRLVETRPERRPPGGRARAADGDAAARPRPRPRGLRRRAATYDAAGSGPAMAKFIALVMQDGELDADYARPPGPGPGARSG